MSSERRSKKPRRPWSGLSACPGWGAAARFLLVVVLAGCGGRGPKAGPSVEPKVGATEEGIASWYGHPYHGRRTANGEVYDMESDTAAHNTLPFDTWVRVVNLDNGRSTRVRINDRGPFVGGRIIDLSRRAAREIGMIRNGTARVRVEILSAPQPVSERYAVQVGSFRRRDNARRLVEQLRGSYDPVFIQQSGPYFRVRVGRLPSIAEAERLASRLRRHRDIRAAVVVRL